MAHTLRTLAAHEGDVTATAQALGLNAETARALVGAAVRWRVVRVRDARVSGAETEAACVTVVAGELSTSRAAVRRLAQQP